MLGCSDEAGECEIAVVLVRSCTGGHTEVLSFVSACIKPRIATNFLPNRRVPDFQVQQPPDTVIMVAVSDSVLLEQTLHSRWFEQPSLHTPRLEEHVLDDVQLGPATRPLQGVGNPSFALWSKNEESEMDWRIPRRSAPGTRRR